ncbi:hypothetical protein Cgig2_009469 [Carnegiea gigantea]|uniref:Uncharacterized protein n=1 Tax=Carnegiea gigantea TaxID=171969 RepID=A0A9Q1K7B1_9CARY|nr:hypothetical protein Cgig2_009469 [Carnegiea gigantea]
MDDSLGKSQESPKHMHKTEKEKVVLKNAKGVHGITKPPMWNEELDNQTNKRGKEVVLRQQPKRIVKETPFQCRSPFLKDHREGGARDHGWNRSRHRKSYSGYAVSHPKLDGKKEESKYAKKDMALEKGSMDLSKAFKTVMDLERERYITSSFIYGMQNRGHKKETNLKKFSLAFWKLSWQDDTNIHDYGIYSIRYMETFRGGQVENWRPGFELNKAPTDQIYNTPYAT